MDEFNEFDDFAIDLDSDCLHQDFDDVDLYGEKEIEPEDNEFGNEIILN